MTPPRPDAYGEHLAPIYDELYPAAATDAEVAAARLAELARGGRALELGIGTGRVALALAARGVEVHGIDSSEAMVALLRAKPGGRDVPVTIGDMTAPDVVGPFRLIYIVFSTLFNLGTQEAQVQCIQHAARLLDGDGVFVVEAFVPDPAAFPDGQATRTVRVEDGRVLLTATQHDPAAQRLQTQLVDLSESGVRLVPYQLRYAWPAEIDLMARLAGLRLRRRWASWRRAPFAGAARQHISIYGHG
jgi:SAM-dependent methyltransferase